MKECVGFMLDEDKMNTTKNEEIILRQNKDVITYTDVLNNNRAKAAAQTITSKQCKQ